MIKIKHARACIVATIIFSFNSLHAQTIIQRDPEIEAMIKEISKDSLLSYDKKMVSFGTRNTLSTQKDAARGIGAARN